MVKERHAYTRIRGPGYEIARSGENDDAITISKDIGNGITRACDDEKTHSRVFSYTGSGITGLRDPGSMQTRLRGRGVTSQQGPSYLITETLTYGITGYHSIGYRVAVTQSHLIV